MSPRVLRPLDEAIEQVESYITQQRLPPHTRLPSERELCALWDMNRTTLRNALQHLMREGIIYSRHGSGTYVAAEKLVCNLQDLSSLSDAVRRAGRRLETRVLEARVIECDKQLVKKMRLPLGHKLFVLTRLRFVDGVPFVIEISHLDYERHPGLEAYDFSSASLYQVLRERYHDQIQQGEEKLGVTYCTEDEARCLELAYNSPVFFLRGTTLDGEGTVLEHFKNIARPDQIRYASSLT